MEIKYPYGFIYITTCMINGKRYIGQRQFKNYGGKRWDKYLGSGTIFLKAVKKYGRDSFYRDIVAIAYSKEELDNLEIEWIKNYNAVENDDFYNIADGGHGGNKYAGKTEEEMLEIRKKISIANSGENNPMYGIHMVSPMKDKHHSEEAKQKMSKSNAKVWLGKRFSEEHKKKMGENSGRAKKVICLTTGQIFDSAKEGAIFYNCDNSNILKNCKGKLKSCGILEDGTKLVWSFFNEENTLIA